MVIATTTKGVATTTKLVATTTIDVMTTTKLMATTRMVIVATTKLMATTRIDMVTTTKIVATTMIFAIFFYKNDFCFREMICFASMFIKKIIGIVYSEKKSVLLFFISKTRNSWTTFL